MRMFANVVSMLVLWAALNCSNARGADAQAATRPAPIDEVVKVAPINLKTNGVMPNKAFEMLADATGVRIAAAQRVARGANGTSVPIDLWGDRAYPRIDFDLEQATFWQAIDRLCAKADVQISRGDHQITLYPYYFPLSADGSDRISDAPLFRAHERTAFPADLAIGFEIDPRVRIIEWERIVVDPTRDENNQEIRLELVEPVGHEDSMWSASYLLGTKPLLAGARRLAEVRGYASATAAISTREVEVPLQIGAKVAVGPWIVELVDRADGGSNLGSTTELFLGIEPADKNSLAVPGDLRALVDLRDGAGATMPRDTRPRGQPRGQLEARKTVTGGMRQRMTFWWAHDAANGGKPAKLIFSAPLEYREVSLAFAFKDVKLP